MKLLVICLIIIVILLIVGYFIVGNYFYNIALNRNTPKSLILGEETEEQKFNREKNLLWMQDNSEEIYITSSNQSLKLHAYEIQNQVESDIWTIIIHGYSGQGSDMIYIAKEFLDRGYNTLIVDLRGHGKSEGNYIGMGWPDRLDIIDWSNYIISKNKASKIILYGVSMGAATVMMATGEELPENIKVAIEDCGYTSVWEEFKIQLNNIFNLPTFPVLNAASAVCKIKAGYMLEEGSAVEQVRKSKTPTLFIHGDQDRFVPFEMLDVLYEAANCEKQKLVVEGAAHAEAVGVNPSLYWRTIDEFIDKNI